MKFFEGVRPSAYIQGAKLWVDKKTSVRSWRLTLAVTMASSHVYACSEVITSNFEQIDAEENRCSALDIAEEPPAQRLSFYKLVGDTEAVLSLGCWTVAGLRMTKVEGLVELWMVCDHVNTDTLHRFVKDYAFTRVWLAFEANQAAPEPSPVEPVSEAVGFVQATMDTLIAPGGADPAVADAIEQFAESVTASGLTSVVTLSSGGRTVTIDKSTAGKIRKARAAAKKEATS